GIQFARGLDQIFQRIISMRKVHNRQKWLSHIHALKSSRNTLQGVKSFFDNLVRNASGLRCPHRRQNIVDVDAPHQRRSNLQFSLWSIRGELKAVKRELKFLRGDVSRVFDPVGERVLRQTKKTI